ncbi:MAG: acyl-CoA dehydrogenase family protein [Candidatus Omnitrophica bacterium]|nr:acyl-CoA dehydrogenase family protein [Candidatus Omnitrophota bacterium]
MPTPFHELDYYEINLLLTDDERAVRDQVRRFVDDRFLPRIQECFEKGEFPFDLIKDIARLGLFGACHKEFGLPGVSDVAYGLIMQELERGDSGLRSFVSVQSALVMYAILRYGSEAQKKRWIPRLASGESIGCFGLTEPDFGSDPSGMLTSARKRGSAYVLSGTKMWITNGSAADIAVVWAKRDGEIYGFLVEKGTKGFSAKDITGKLSLRASATSELHFENCEIPEENLMPGSKGIKAALACLTQARYGIAWGAIGAAQACFHIARDYALSRIQFGKPIAAFQLTQEKLVDMATEITKAQLLALQMGRLKQAGKLDFAQVAMAKRSNVSAALGIARSARSILGANGIMNEYGVMRHMTNLESVYTYEGTHEMQTLIVGQDLTGLEAFR